MQLVFTNNFNKGNVVFSNVKSFSIERAKLIVQFDKSDQLAATRYLDDLRSNDVVAHIEEGSYVVAIHVVLWNLNWSFAKK